MAYPLDPRKQWQYTQVKNLLGGINLDAKPDMIQDDQAIQLDNIIAKAGGIGTDTGYAAFGLPVLGIPQTTYEFLRQDLTSQLILITTKTVYKWNITFEEWQLIRGTAGTTTTASFGSGATVINVASAAGFSTGDSVGITLDNGQVFQSIITVAGTNFTLATPVPSGRSILNNGAIVRAVVLAGTLDHEVTPATIAGSDWMVFTNAIDIVKYYDGTECKDIPNLPSAGNTTCESLVVYNTALFLLNTIEGGTQHGQRVRRSDQLNPTNWTTGTAGYDDLLDTSDKILTGDLLGPYLIIYRDRSIARGSFIGSSGMNYFFETMITGEGVLSGGALIPTGDSHIIVGHANVYEYLADYTLNPIGDQIFYLTFGYSGNLNPQYRQRLFALYIEELDEAWIFYPSTSSPDGTCDTLLRYNVGDKFWYTRHFANTFVGFGFYTKTNANIWSTLVGTWLDQNYTWNSRISFANTDITHLCSSQGNQVFAYDYNTQLDNQTAITYTVETKDFALPDSEFRLDMIEMFIRGTNVLLQYSTDSGYSWNTLSNINQNIQEKVRVYKQVVTHRIRFKWSGNSNDFALEWFGFSYKIESLY